MYNSINQIGGSIKPLVVYYSLTDKTKLVAQVIAETLNATLLEIKETKPRKLGPFVYWTGGFAAIMNRGSKINPIDVDLKQYETIFIGSPIWGSSPAPAINSFIYQTNFEGRSIIPFFTMDGDNPEKALANITAKIEENQGKVAGSFAITSYGVSDEEIIARAKEAIKNYLDYHYSINWVEEPNRKQAGGDN
jgi:flavodoxin